MKEHVKRILVPLDPSPYAQAATETACRIARHHTSQVAGVAVLDSAEIQSSMIPAVGPYYPGVIDAVQKMRSHAKEVLDDCLKRFADTCEENKVAHLETEYEGIPAQKVLESAIFFDLVVVGLRTAFHFETRDEPTKGLDGLLGQTITPILAVPETGLKDLQKVLITFDGSLGSSRALHDFARFAQPYTDAEIKIITSGKNKTETEFLLHNAAAFLRSHGYSNVSTEEVETPIINAVDAIDDLDLVVAGIHSKRPIKDMFVGSFTTSLINRGDTALFLSH